jgi:AAA domain-containing protein
VPFRVPQDAADLRRRVAQRKAALVVIDPLMEFIDGKVDSHKSHPLRQAIASLNAIAREHGCAVLVVFHLNKGASTDPLVRHEGSAAFTQVVRGGLMLGHDPDDPDGEDGNQRVLAVSSTNLAAIAPSIVYRISTAHVIGDTGEAITTAAIAPIGQSCVGAHDLLRGQPNEEERTVTDEAVVFLRAELADGPRLASEIKAEARKLGLSDMALFRGRRTLGVKSLKTGFKGGWEWSLPEVSRPNISRPPSPHEIFGDFALRAGWRGLGGARSCRRFHSIDGEIFGAQKGLLRPPRRPQAGLSLLRIQGGGLTDQLCFEFAERVSATRQELPRTGSLSCGGRFRPAPSDYLRPSSGAASTSGTCERLRSFAG